MDVLEAIRGRRSIRRFRNDPIPADLVPVLEESLVAAPSAGNLHARHFYLVTRSETLRKLATATYSQQFVAKVPLAVVCCAGLGYPDESPVPPEKPPSEKAFSRID